MLNTSAQVLLSVGRVFDFVNDHHSQVFESFENHKFWEFWKNIKNKKPPISVISETSKNQVVFMQEVIERPLFLYTGTWVFQVWWALRTRNTYQNHLFESIENHIDKPQELPG